MNNSMTQTHDGKIGVLPVDTNGNCWITLFTHVLEEYACRGASPQVLSGKSFPKHTASDLPKSVLALRDFELPKPGQALVKLGKRAHMTELFKFGRIRVAPARSYSDPSLNYAVGDDELSFSRISPGSEVTITRFDKCTGEPKSTKPISEVTYTKKLETDFYIYCMTHTLTYRLFEDFEANACVIIRDPASFCTRFREAMNKKLPNWSDWDQAVHYIDPYLSSEKSVGVVFSKHFRHWYQQEYRFAWFPKKCGQDPLEPIFVELGSIERISELIHL